MKNLSKAFGPGAVRLAACGLAMAFAAGALADTADWSVFRNERYGFEIRFPPDWHAHGDNPGGYANDNIGYDGMTVTVQGPPHVWKTDHVTAPMLVIKRKKCPASGSDTAFHADPGTRGVGREKTVCVGDFVLEMLVLTEGVDATPYETELDAVGKTFAFVSRSAGVLDPPTLPAGSGLTWEAKAAVFPAALGVSHAGRPSDRFRPVDLPGMNYSARFHFARNPAEARDTIEAYTADFERGLAEQAYDSHLFTTPDGRFNVVPYSFAGDDVDDADTTTVKPDFTTGRAVISQGKVRYVAVSHHYDDRADSDFGFDPHGPPTISGTIAIFVSDLLPLDALENASGRPH
jgi:hypothetical protein